MRLFSILASLLISTLMISCEKTIEGDFLEKDSDRINKNTSLRGLSYGNDLFYLGGSASENVVKPVSKPSLQGKFVSIPQGLSLNGRTGEIDLSKSLTGQAYKIFYVSEENRLIDSARIVISGIDYEDGLYRINRNTRKFGKRAETKYNASNDVSLQNSILNSFETTGNKKKQIIMDQRTGAIDLEASLNAGLLGNKKPGKGSNVEFSVEYKLADRSKRVKNKTDVLVYYFDNENDMPVELKQTLEMREYIKKRVDVMPPPGWTSTTDPEEGDPLEEDLLAYKVRPPLIIIVGQ